MPKGAKRYLRKQKPKTNINDVWIRLIDAVHDIINSGNFIGVIVVVVLVLIWRLPPENINEHLRTLISLFSSDRFYIVPLGGLTLFEGVIIFYQRKIYKSEIKRLALMRSEIMHGLESGQMKTLDKHQSSNYKPDE